MHEAVNSKLVHWDNPEGWDGEGGGRWGQDGDTRKPVAESVYGKNHHDNVK